MFALSAAATSAVDCEIVPQSVGISAKSGFFLSNTSALR